VSWTLVESCVSGVSKSSFPFTSHLIYFCIYNQHSTSISWCLWNWWL
jgi:hypothetical protein